MKKSSGCVGACFFFIPSITGIFRIGCLLTAFMAAACSNLNRSDAVFIKENLVIPLQAGEEMLPKDLERVEHYFALLGDTPFQIPLLQPVKGEEYTLFTALPVAADLRKIEQSWENFGSDFHRTEQEDWKFAWRNRDTLNHRIFDVVAQRDQDVVYFLIAQKDDANRIYNADSLILRLRSLHHTP